MALLVFIDFFTEESLLHRGISSRRLEIRLEQIERKVKTVARALALATTSRPNLQKVFASAGPCTWPP